ncbi:hypothetical protein [Bacillus cereus]
MATLAEMQEQLELLLKIPLETIDEGCTEKNIGIGQKKKQCYSTQPKSVELIKGEDGTGTIRYHYDCRYEKVIVTGGLLNDSERHSRPGIVVARYAITFSRQVMISDIHIEGNKEGRCADSIITKLNELNGKKLI